MSPIISESDYVLHEESWNAYPYCRTIVTNPSYMKDSFRVILETIHLPDRGSDPNPLDRTYIGHSEEIDITGPKAKKLPENLGEPSAHMVMLNGGNRRGPLRGPGWVSRAKPVMTCYKQITVVCEFGFLTNTLEREIMNYYREIFLAFHQKVWLSIGHWIPLTLEQVRKAERLLQHRETDE